MKDIKKSVLGDVLATKDLPFGGISSFGVEVSPSKVFGKYGVVVRDINGHISSFTHLSKSRGECIDWLREAGFTILELRFLGKVYEY